MNKKDKVSAGTHVDDILVSATINDLDIFDVDIKKIYVVTCNRKGNLSYISLYIMSDKYKNYLVSQKGYRMDVVGNYRADIDKIKEIVRTPAHINLIEDKEEDIPYDNKSHFLSIVMSLMYLARLTRYEILFAVSYLATKSQNPSLKHYKAACRVLRYIECSGDIAILFRSKCRFGIRISCDSSHRMYKDGKGQGGIMVSIGSGVVHARSYKIKITVLSPSESEGVTVCEAGTYAIFMICLCRALGHSWGEEDFVTIKQDNLFTIWLQSHDGY